MPDRVSLLAILFVATTAVLPPVVRAADAPASPPPASAPPPGASSASPALTADDGGELGVDVIGARPLFGAEPAAALLRIPGAGNSLDRTVEVKFKSPISIQDALRGQPGVSIRGEDAVGLTPNIGFRGLNPDRSERMLILEDGVPAGLAPYIENAAYYIPPFERMARIEVLKGSGQILYGPHTVGGVLNLVTPEIPTCPAGSVRALAGSHGYLLGYAEAGGTWGPLGVLATVLQKRGDGFKEDSEFDVQDVTLKGRWTFSDRTNLTAKLNWYEQESKQTYLGLTTGLYEQDAYRNLAPNDQLDVSWWSGQLTLRHEFTSCARLLANAYVSDATRDWNRQDFARNTGFAAPPANTVETVGDTTVDGGAVYMRASFGSRDRYFLKWGIEPRLLMDGSFLGRPTEVEVGVRYHEELMIDERNNRATFVAPPVTRDRDIRRVEAMAGWAQARFELSGCFDVTAGLRVEDFDASRHIVRAANAPVDVEGDSHTTEWIPGLGFTYRLAGHTLFGGVHRGYAPPRTSQAIDSSGTDAELEAEHSWNYELGVRAAPCTWLTWSATGFYNDFTNIVVPDNESGGSSTENTNAGETEMYGLELTGSVDLVSWFRRTPCCAPLDRCTSRLWLDVAYTYTHTENVTAGGLFEGNELPYAPRHTGSVGLRFEAPSGFDVGAFAVYTGEQFTDQAETEVPSADGTRGRIDDRWVVDLVAGWDVPGTSLRLHGALRNVFDETYIASRAPEGIFPGAPRHWYLGIELDF
ncbi:MAG: TonB-dependent receptor [Planctomycetia bacterium]|nr:TonB-dependent receptor [Planctomycetia bacterium]